MSDLHTRLVFGLTNLTQYRLSRTPSVCELIIASVTTLCQVFFCFCAIVRTACHIALLILAVDLQ